MSSVTRMPGGYEVHHYRLPDKSVPLFCVFALLFLGLYWIRGRGNCARWPKFTSPNAQKNALNRCSKKCKNGVKKVRPLCHLTVTFIFKTRPRGRTPKSHPRVSKMLHFLIQKLRFLRSKNDWARVPKNAHFVRQVCESGFAPAPAGR